MEKKFSQDTYFYNVIDAIKESKENNDVDLGQEGYKKILRILEANRNSINKIGKQR